MAIIEKEFIELTKGLDIKKFWGINSRCKEFTTNKPRCEFSFSPDDHWLFEFIGLNSTIKYYNDKKFRDSIHKEVNDITLKYVGKTFFSEDTWSNSPKRIENLFGCYFTYTEGQTPWLKPVTDNLDEFKIILDNAEKTNIREWVFPDAFLKEWDNRKSAGKDMPRLGGGSRGPATIMSSVLSVENLFFWMYDYPELIERFRNILTAKMLELNRVLREFSGNNIKGWWITDDNCALFNKRFYKKYCMPVLEKVLNEMAPGNSIRSQHSDSAMGHIIPFQKELGINSVNYGPEVDVALIRELMPEAMICGHIPPMMLRNSSPEEIRERVISDFEKAGKTGGLKLTTAGSLSAGTGVGRMRWLMKLVEEYCIYNG